jgi:23S rRNA (cytidine1920-2'-O)/16S rRNA (cytidine1409-2'-O)-methyltransferase
MTRRRSRAPFVALARLVGHRTIEEGRVIVDGRVIANPRALVRRDAAIRVEPERRLRGEAKLGAALDALPVDVRGVVAVDVGAAAGGFTAALLARGAARVYAVDVGVGQLRGRLRADPRVVDLERTNVADLDRRLVPEAVGLVTLDLSYLPVAEAIGDLDGLRYAPAAALVALVKPTFELRAGALVTDPAAVRAAIRRAGAAIGRAGWRVEAATLPAVTGRGGAVEAFVLARR